MHRPGPAPAVVLMWHRAQMSTSSKYHSEHFPTVSSSGWRSDTTFINGQVTDLGIQDNQSSWTLSIKAKKLHKLILPSFYWEVHEYWAFSLAFILLSLCRSMSVISLDIIPNSSPVWKKNKWIGSVTSDWRIKDTIKDMREFLQEP